VVEDMPLDGTKDMLEKLTAPISTTMEKTGQREEKMPSSSRLDVDFEDTQGRTALMAAAGSTSIIVSESPLVPYWFVIHVEERRRSYFHIFTELQPSPLFLSFVTQFGPDGARKWTT
jgi:hypothetical protein